MNWVKEVSARKGWQATVGTALYTKLKRLEIEQKQQKKANLGGE